MLAVRQWLGAFLVSAVLMASALLFGNQPPAYANPWADVNCEQEPDHPVCDVEAGSSGGAMVVGPGGEVVCRLDGEVVPCVTDEGWLGVDGCRYLRLDESPPSGVTEPGAAYRVRCPGDPPNSQRALVWLSDAEAPGPAELGRIAASRLVLPQPEVVVNPPAPAPQLVMLPTWLWVEPLWWAVPRSASASVPGVTVVASATPVRVVWSMGDGSTVSCEGPGTPYAAGGDPVAGSPDCGYTYTRTSTDQSEGAFEVSATVTWQVTWSGGGASGAAGPLSSTVTMPVAVVEVRSVNTGGAR
jgi:hypothetical protein